MATEKKTEIQAEVKKVEEAVAQEAAKIEEKAVELKEDTKKTAKKAADKAKAETKKAGEAAKKTAEKVTSATKKTADKAVAAAKKIVAPEASVTIEYQGKQFVAKSILDQAIAAYKEAHKGAALKTIEIYVKPEEGVAYYVVNGEGSDDYKIAL